jgi:hypothetical protein
MVRGEIKYVLSLFVGGGAFRSSFCCGVFLHTVGPSSRPSLSSM